MRLVTTIMVKAYSAFCRAQVALGAGHVGALLVESFVGYGRCRAMDVEECTDHFLRQMVVPFRE
jgi:hypothetical protein